MGKHPLTCRLLKGVFNLRPPIPRYDCTWDIAVVTSYLKGLGDNSMLQLKTFTLKLATLLALVLAHRSSGLVRLTLQGRRYSPEGVVLSMSGLAKQSRPGKEESLQPVTIPQFGEDKRLCKSVQASKDTITTLVPYTVPHNHPYISSCKPGLLR